MIPSNKEKEIYSTEEVRIGTWIDGKPLYRKVIDYSNTIAISNGNRVVLGSIADVENMINFSVIALIQDHWDRLPYASYSGHNISSNTAQNFYANYMINTNNVVLVTQCGSAVSTNNIYRCIVTAEYTKTTD